jgi:hypothetical protein
MSTTPGLFRLCYAAYNYDVVAEAVSRIVKVLSLN